MPWKEVSTMSLRSEFVVLCQSKGASVSTLCARFQISRKTAYKWLARYRALGTAGLVDASRRPRSSPCETPLEIQEQVVELRTRHPAWGGRKLRRRLLDAGLSLGQVPAASTITQILRRAGLLELAESQKRQPFCRFEHAAPNDLWQMDFKGHFALTRGGRCHPLTILDDHSRYALSLRACGDETAPTVQSVLVDVFRRYGLPCRMLMDNGSPWGDAADNPYTGLVVWLIRLGLGVSHGRPWHPQTQGKEERFHRTLKAELLRGRSFLSLEDSQRAFDPWRETYNLERPHEALNLETPASRYRVSGRVYPEALPPIEYAADVEVRQVQSGGLTSFHGRRIRVGRAFAGQPLGLRATSNDGVWSVQYCHQPIGTIDLRETGKGQLATLTISRRGGD